MPLTDTALRAIKPSEKQQKFFDGHGLYLAVSPSGTKSWRFKYHHAGREKLLTLGQYPVVSLKEARERTMEAKKTLSAGKDPSIEKKLNKLQQKNSFELVAREWLEKQSHVWTHAYIKQIRGYLEKRVFLSIGSRPVADVSALELLEILRKMEAQGFIAMAHTVRGICGTIFRYAVATGRAERDPSADLRGVLIPRVRKHHAAITDPDKFGELLLQIDNYHGTLVVRCAMQFLALTFCRTAEVRNAEWAEFDFKDNLWRIPGEKMKMSRDHLVPLSPQALAILEAMRPHTGDTRYVFTSRWTAQKPLGVYSVLGALRNMGVCQEDMTPHGFRTTASTLLNEQGYPPDVIERQLAHAPLQNVRAIYNRAEYLPERRKMMVHWANYLDLLRERARQATGA